MVDLNDIRPSIKNDGHRNTDQIRQDIAQAEQEMSQTVEQIGDRIKEKLDWQQYVKDAPYLALGIAAGVGFLAAGMLVKKTTPMDRFLDTLTDEVRNVTGGLVARTAGAGIIKVSLLGIASKAAVNWLQDATDKSTTIDRKNSPGCCTTPENKSTGGPPGIIV